MLEFRLSALSSENYNIIEGGVAWATTACLRGGVDKRFVALRGGQGWGVPTWQIVGVHIRTALLFLRDPLVDQFFSSSEKRLARMLLLLAHFGKEGTPETVVPRISQETLAEMVGTTRSRVSFFMNKFRKLGFIH